MANGGCCSGTQKSPGSGDHSGVFQRTRPESYLVHGIIGCVIWIWSWSSER